jgi:hypothetical protein
LETFAVWSGRYPAPLKPEKFVPVKGEDTPVLYADGTVVAGPDGEPEMIEGHLHLPDVATTRDISDVNRLFDRLLGLLDTEPAVASATLPPSPI